MSRRFCWTFPGQERINLASILKEAKKEYPWKSAPARERERETVIIWCGSFKYARHPVRPRSVRANSKKTDETDVEKLAEMGLARGKRTWTRNSRGSRLSRLIPSSSRGVFRSCWNAIHRILGQDGKSIPSNLWRRRGAAAAAATTAMRTPTRPCAFTFTDVYIFIRV